MRRLIYSLIIALFICNYAFAQNSIIEKDLQEIMNLKSDELININIVFKAQMDSEELNDRVANIDSKTARREATIRELKMFSEKSQQEVLSIIRSEERNGKSSQIKSHWLSNSITCNATKEVIDLLAQRDDIFVIGLNADKNVILANSVQQSAVSGQPEITSNVTQVNAPDVWEQGYTGEGVLVAIIDSGVNYNHPDLADHLWDGGAEYPNHGYNSYDDNIDPMDGTGHGTHCAGTICGDGTGGKQTGVAPNATLMCVKAINSSGNANVNSIVSGMEFAVEHGAQVLSMSLGIANSSISERTMLRQTCVNTLQLGVVASVACGNEGGSAANPIPNNVRVPGSCPAPWIHPDQQVNAGETSCVVSVGAVANNNTVAGMSSRGPVTWQETSFGDYPYNPGIGLIRPDICAPGVDVVSLDKDTNGYTKKTGTSMAAPCVAGVMCLMLSKDNTLTPAEISMLLETTAEKLSETKNNDTGSGKVNALAAVNSIDMGAIKYISFTINDENGNNNNVINPGEEIIIDLVVDNTSSENFSDVTAVMTCENEWVNITNDNIEIDNIGTTEFTSIDGQLRFTVDEDAESETPLHFDVEFYKGNEKISKLRFSTVIYDNTIKYSSFIVMNDDNGNGTLEAGETADLGVTLINTGNEMAVDLSGILSSSSNLITINESEANFSCIAPDGNATAYFNVTLASNAGSSLDIPFAIEVKDKYNKTNNFSMNYISTCEVVFNLIDEFGDGWNGAKLLVHYSDGSESDTYTITSGTSATYTKTLNSGVNVSLEWKKGGVDNECIYSINYANGTEIFSGKGRQDGVFFNWIYDCSCQNAMFQNGEGVNNFEIIKLNYSVELKWEAPETQEPLYYELYRDNMLIEVTAEHSFFDEDLSSGTYFYNVRPVYEGSYGELVGDVVTFNVNTEEINAINADIYPNPSDDRFVVRCERMTNIVIFNIMGEKVMERELNGDSYEIDGLENGIYFVNIETENGSAVRKVVKY